MMIPSPSYSSRGPRKDNGDQNPLNELIPEIGAPGTNIIQAEDVSQAVDAIISSEGTLQATHTLGAEVERRTTSSSDRNRGSDLGGK